MQLSKWLRGKRGRSLDALHVARGSDSTTTRGRSLAGDDEGATAVEYAVMLALVLAVIIASVTIMGGQTNTMFEKSNEQMTQHGLGQ